VVCAVDLKTTSTARTADQVYNNAPATNSPAFVTTTSPVETVKIK
jgi:hypothetical protein